MRTHRPTASGFTLVELLVVIGIIALLIGILVPVLNKARQASKAIACQSNLKTIGQGIHLYAAQNKGSLPWGFVYHRYDANTGAPLANGYYTWVSLIDNEFGFALTKRAGGAWQGDASKVWKCPETGDTFPHKMDYGQHMVAMPDMINEIAGEPSLGVAGTSAANMPVIKPATLTQLYPDNALVWDVPGTLFMPDWYPGWTQTFIDGGQLLDPNVPEYRYRGDSDAFAGDPYLSQNNSIWTPKKSFYKNTNTDANAPGGAEWGQTNVPRWRHNGNKVCNVAFADGSVQALQWYPGSAEEYPEGVASDFKRKMIMIKWPSNKKWSR
jgi:prepilin-type processing-associated H-X9-DG protein/prepilin-type N-terminal cleavage/methylation domain-containing protein